MSTLAESCITDLDKALAEFGEDITLQRLTADPETGEQVPTFQASCRAVVRAHQPQELVVMSGEAPNTTVVLSPTDLARALWPGTPQKDDRAIIQDRATNIEIVSPFYVAGVLVRVELQCRE